jgi:hypothetical protein
VISAVVHSKMLERVTIDLFQFWFPNSFLNIDEKSSGVQMGLKASATLSCFIVAPIVV